MAHSLLSEAAAPPLAKSFPNEFCLFQDKARAEEKFCSRGCEAEEQHVCPHSSTPRSRALTCCS
ncbi:hypothetical protein E2C01_051670 [Portunus trituberculatus]|uniref:Uncharacterized protein n=1 Tax=Portunus trituberculatus TaxID=210409 RepID=A0A5B7GJQ0_PORTR|nr:hypothetical protein [Portunus trituberculatus]